MKSTFFSLMLVLLVALPGQAQDRIITWNNDTIVCEITNSGGHFIRFNVYQNGIETKGKINRSEAKKVIYDEGRALRQSTGAEFRPWRVDLSGGLSYLVGDTKQGREEAERQGLTPDEVDDYYQQILMGAQGQANLHYFIEPGLAVGLNYRYYSTQADLYATFDPQDGVNLYHGRLEEKMFVNYVGPSLLSQYALSSDHKLLLSGAFSAGVAFFRDETSLLGTGFILTGNSFALNTHIGLEYFVMKQVSFGLNLGVFASKITKVKLDNGYQNTTIELEDDEQQNLTSLDLGAGLRIYF
jgi:hypothetical protein